MPDDFNFMPAQLLAEGFASHLQRWAQQAQAPDTRLVYAAALQTSIATSAGHVCTHLSEVVPSAGADDMGRARQSLLNSGVVGTPAAPASMPLILDEEGRIYLHRYFDYERRLAQRLLLRVAELDQATPTADTQRLLNELFAGNTATLQGRTDWQKLAAALALQGRLTIISGGPGTGKTTTVVNLLACLISQNPDCRIALAAPTGKAAARMLEAIRRRAAALPATLQMHLPTEAFTIHRLLGVTTEAGRFRHHANHPLAIDALVVDEASMLDLALATKLFDAVPNCARIILLGDKDQLAAVESGAVFAELSADPGLSSASISRLASFTGLAANEIQPPPGKITPLRDSVVWFTENFRFAQDSGIGQLATYINSGDAVAAVKWLRTEADPAICWLEDETATLRQTSIDYLLSRYAAYITAVQFCSPDLTRVFAAFDEFRTLCAVREGSRGIIAINGIVSRYFRQRLNHPLDLDTRSEWYPGRPVLMLRNDYLLKLFNGDIGILLPDANGKLQAFFPDSETGFRAVALLRLPEHETAFAMTVHKSQGSEFGAVLLILPAEPNRVVGRELLYTAVTRARAPVSIISSADVFQHAIDSPNRRHSGLIARLQEAASSLEAADRLA